MSRAEIKFDGGRRGRKGDPLAAYACVVTHYSDDGSVSVVRESKTLGSASVNEAEYMGMMRGVMIAFQEFRASEVDIYGDSQLVIRQLTGDYKCRSGQLKMFLEPTLRILNRAFIRWDAHWIRREKNAEADHLLNTTLDSASA